MASTDSFKIFLRNIEPKKAINEYVSSIQSNIRDFLENHEAYKNIYENSFLSGSYRKNTAIKPTLNGKKRDVDIIIITSHSRAINSVDVINELYNIIKETGKYKNVQMQKRSVSVEMAQVSVDLVPVIKEYDSEILLIGNSKVNEWIKTNPKCHIKWATKINNESNEIFKKVVKIFKWWNKENSCFNIKFPKGITLEKLISDNLPSVFNNIEEIIYQVMNNIVNYLSSILNKDNSLILKDPCLEENNLFENYAKKDLEAYVERLSNHVKMLEDEEFSNQAWRNIFGNEFPCDSTKENTEEFIQDFHKTNIQFPISIDCKVYQNGWAPFDLRRDIEKIKCFRKVIL